MDIFNLVIFFKHVSVQSQAPRDMHVEVTLGKIMNPVCSLE